MIALDTNVLIRFLIKDDEPQAMRARALLEACREKGEACLVTNPVLCEVEWVLDIVYKASRANIAEALRILQTTPPFALEDEALMERALRSYARGKGDFSDYLLGEIGEARGARTTFTFDRKLRGGGGFTLI